MDAFRIGLAGGSGIKGIDLVARQTTACNLQNGDLYTFPNSTSTIDGTVPLTFTWNTRCPGISSTVDLYLYSDALGLIKQWGNIPFSNGQFQVQLLPRWWNSTTTARLQVNIQNSGGMSWNTIGPPGPWFKVDYPVSAMLTTTTEGGMLKTLTNSAAATNGGDAIFQNVASTNNGGISKGAIAAAVVVPIIVIALIVGIAVKFWRQREAEKRKRWSQALSSTSNLDWEKGARPGERTGSIMGRPSMSSYGQPRASMAASSVWGENMAGAGAGATGGTTRPPVMRNVSNDGSASIHNPRISRISFAESARPERPDRRSRLSMGNDLRPHSAVFNLKPGSRSASDLPSSNLGHGSPSPSKKRAIQGMQGSAIVDDEDEKSSLGAGTPRMKSSRRGSQNSGNRLTVLDNEVRQSTYSAYSQQPSPQHNTSYDNDRTEDLSTLDSKSPLPTAQSTSTVAYGPDSLLQAYANRAQGATSPTGTEPIPMPMPMSMAMAPPAVPSSDSKKGLKIFTAFGKKDKNGAGQGESPTQQSPVGGAGGGGGLQVPNVAMTRNGGGTVGRGASPSSPAPHAL